MLFTSEKGQSFFGALFFCCCVRSGHRWASTVDGGWPKVFGSLLCLSHIETAALRGGGSVGGNIDGAHLALVAADVLLQRKQ